MSHCTSAFRLDTTSAFRLDFFIFFFFHKIFSLRAGQHFLQPLGWIVLQPSGWTINVLQPSGWTAPSWLGIRLRWSAPGGGWEIIYSDADHHTHPHFYSALQGKNGTFLVSNGKCHYSLSLSDSIAVEKLSLRAI